MFVFKTKSLACPANGNIVYTPMNLWFVGNNIGNVIIYGRLAATSLGIGTCWNGWTQMAIEINPKIKRLVGISEEKIGAFIIGYPDVTYYRVPPRSRKRVKALK